MHLLVFKGKGAEAEEQLVELQETIRNLEKQNTGLKNKVICCKTIKLNYKVCIVFYYNLKVNI